MSRSRSSCLNIAPRRRQSRRSATSCSRTPGFRRGTTSPSFRTSRPATRAASALEDRRRRRSPAAALQPRRVVVCTAIPTTRSWRTVVERITGLPHDEDPAKSFSTASSLGDKRVRLGVRGHNRSTGGRVPRQQVVRFATADGDQGQSLYGRRTPRARLDQVVKDVARALLSSRRPPAGSADRLAGS